MIKFVKLDLENNCIEVTWAEDGVNTRCHTYQPEQQAEFEAEVEGAAQYVNLITWSQA